MSSSLPGEITFLLSKGNSPDALWAVMPRVYPELRQIAVHHFRRERRDHTLQATALVHEAFIRLFEHGPKKYANRGQFFGIVSRLMRQVLVDHARRRKTLKRAGAWRRVPWDEADVVLPECPDVLALDQALTRLHALDPRLGKIAELRLFGGLSTREAGALLGRAPSTARGDWKIARTWLQRDLGCTR